MEAVGAAGSVVGIVGVAGQILQGLIFLHGFFREFRDIPEDVQSLVQELNCLEALFRRIAILAAQASSPIASATTTTVPGAAPAHSYLEELMPALEFCDRWVKILRDLVDKHESTANASRSMRTWSNLRLAFRRKRWSEYTAALQQGKSMVLQSHLAIVHSTILEHNSSTKEAVTSIMHQLSRLASNHDSYVTMFARGQDSADQNAQEIKSTLASLLAEMNTQQLSAATQTTLERIIATQIKRELQTHHERLRIETSLATPLRSVQTFSARPRPEEPSLSTEGSERKLLTHSSPRKRPGRRLKYAKSYNLWFGTLLLSSEVDNAEGSSSSVRTEIIILPALLLLHKGAVMTINRFISSYSRPVISYSIRPLTVLRDHHPMLLAISSGNTPQVQQLFATRQASPFDYTARGTNLMGVVFEEIFNVAFEYSQWDRLSFESRGRGCRLANKEDGIKLLNDLKTVAKLLIDVGVDAGARDDKKDSTPIHTCLMTLGLNLCPRDDELYSIAENAIKKSTSNPLLVGCSSFLMFLLRETPSEEQPSLQRIQHLFLENEDWTITSESGGCDALTWLTKELYLPVEAEPKDWAAWRPTEMTSQFLRHRSMTIAKLMEAAQDGREDLLKNTESSSGLSVYGEVACNIYNAIKFALIENSPSKRTGLSDQDYRLRQHLAVEDIATMLSFMPEIATASFQSSGHESLTRWATRWEVLDLWRKSLQASDYYLDEVTHAAWEANRHLYELVEDGEFITSEYVDQDWKSDAMSDELDEESIAFEPDTFGWIISSHPAYSLLT